MWRLTRRWLGPVPPSSTDIRAAFKVLGLSYNPYSPPVTVNEQVRKHYRELARLHHPDLSSGDDNRMKVINTAYELIQSSGVLQGARLDGKSGNVEGATPGSAAGSTTGTSATTAGAEGQRSRFSRNAGSRRHRMPDDFASGDGTSSSWAMRSSLDWQSLMNSTATLTKDELNNPANHPFSHSRFFTFDEDVTIYKMIRGGATVPQVARTVGKPATFIEKRLHNAQFKLRVQYVLRGEKRTGTEVASSSFSTASASAAAGRHDRGKSKPRARHGADHVVGPTGAATAVPNAQERLLKRSPYEEAALKQSTQRNRPESKPSPRQQKQQQARFAFGAQRGGNGWPRSLKKEWEPTVPQWQEPQYYADRSLEDKGRYDGLLKGEEAFHGHDDPVYGGSAEANRRSSPMVASKMGRSYANYARLNSTGAKGQPRNTSPRSSNW